jgi:endoglucanase
VWNWTQDNLQREDGLLAWHWGQRSDGTQGIVDGGAATDADQDTALALLLAAKRWDWDAGRYRRDALTILDGIWKEETAVVNGQRVVVAGDWTRTGANPVINPSYFAPYAYRIFAEADSRYPWNELVDSSYAILAKI